VPMVAIVEVPCVCRAAPIAASMAVQRPEAVSPHTKCRNEVEDGQREAFLSRGE
jgi:hypothetical protein